MAGRSFDAVYSRDFEINKKNVKRVRNVGENVLKRKREWIIKG